MQKTLMQISEENGWGSEVSAFYIAPNNTLVIETSSIYLFGYLFDEKGKNQSNYEKLVDYMVEIIENQRPQHYSYGIHFQHFEYNLRTNTYKVQFQRICYLK